MTSPQTPQEAVIEYYDKEGSFDLVWNFVNLNGEVEAYEIQSLLILAAEHNYSNVDNKQREMENYAAKLESSIEKLAWSHTDHKFTKGELKTFLHHSKVLWKRLRKSLQKKIDDAWENESIHSALMEVLSTPSNKGSPRAYSRNSRSTSAQRYMNVPQQIEAPPKMQSPRPGMVPLQRWMKLAEQKPWGKNLMKKWRRQNVLDALTLDDITDEILKEFSVQKLQRVVLLKWKRQVLAGEDQQAGFSPSRSADRYQRSASARPANTPKSHLYQPSRSMDRRRMPASRSEGRSSSAARRVQQNRPRDPLVELFSHFDKATGWVDQGVLFDLMFSTLLVHRKRVMDANPNTPMPSREEIQPLVNGLVWEVMKRIDLQRSGFLSLQEYLKCAKMLIAEFEKIISKQKTEEIDSDSDDEVKNDVPAPVRKRVASNRTAVTPNAGMGSPTTRIKVDTHSSEFSKLGTEERKIGEELMVNVVKLCKVWNEKEGNTNQLLQFLKHSIQRAEEQLRQLNTSQLNLNTSI